MSCILTSKINGSLNNISFLMKIPNSTNITRFCLTVKSTSATDDGGSGDATWILTSAFIIFTMQSGFGLLEAGLVSAKNECNIMIKNMTDVIFGGLAYWLFGYGLSFGTDSGTNGFVGVGNFLTDAEHDSMGPLFAKFFFQLSFATTATTIVSGAMAERTNLEAYMIYSFINTFTYVFPAHWMWSDQGFLHKMGAVDIAGAGPIHLVGGFSALVATLYLKPRAGRFEKDYNLEMASPTNAVLGTFMLWWGWLGFNCGSTFGVSKGKWKLATRAAINTINGSIGGALFAILYSCRLQKKYKRKLNVPIFTAGILGGLVGITAICTLCRPWEALLIGMIGSVFTCTGIDLLEWLKIDDPVGCIPVHGITGLWSLLAVGLFSENIPHEQSNISSGFFKGGNIQILGVQVLACVCIAAWATVSTLIELFVADKICGLRVSIEEEMLGADYCEHGIMSRIIEEKTQFNSQIDNKSFRRKSTKRINKVFAEKDQNIIEEGRKTEVQVQEAFQNEGFQNEGFQNEEFQNETNTEALEHHQSNIKAIDTQSTTITKI